MTLAIASVLSNTEANSSLEDPARLGIALIVGFLIGLTIVRGPAQRRSAMPEFTDSPAEGTGFEPPVPLAKRAGDFPRCAALPAFAARPRIGRRRPPSRTRSALGRLWSRRSARHDGRRSDRRRRDAREMSAPCPPRRPISREQPATSAARIAAR